MTARIEFLLGMVALVVAGLTLTTLYLRTRVRKAESKHEDAQPGLLSRLKPA